MPKPKAKTTKAMPSAKTVVVELTKAEIYLFIAYELDFGAVLTEDDEHSTLTSLMDKMHKAHCSFTKKRKTDPEMK